MIGTKVRDSDELAYLEARCIQATEKALLCELETGDERWVPKSLVARDSQVTKRGDDGELAVPLWWAEKEGIL
jgi:hypothetical protein